LAIFEDISKQIMIFLKFQKTGTAHQKNFFPYLKKVISLIVQTSKYALNIF